MSETDDDRASIKAFWKRTEAFLEAIEARMPRPPVTRAKFFLDPDDYTCFELHCACGMASNYDGEVPGFVQCPACKRMYHMRYDCQVTELTGSEQGQLKRLRSEDPSKHAFDYYPWYLSILVAKDEWWGGTPEIPENEAQA